MANDRDSGEQERKLEGGSLEKRPSPPASTKASNGLPPAVYIMYGMCSLVTTLNMANNTSDYGSPSVRVLSSSTNGFCLQLNSVRLVDMCSSMETLLIEYDSFP